MDSRLNDLLIDGGGHKISDAHAWMKRRNEYVGLIEQCMLGHAPNDHSMEADIISSRVELEGEAIHEIVQIKYGPAMSHSFLVHIHRPNREGRFPAITWNLFTTSYDCPRLTDAIKRGYVIAEFDKEQLFHDQRTTRTDAADAYPFMDWGAIMIWAWGHSKTADYLVTCDYVDAEKLVATGHSRGGKAALTAGMKDERFTVTAPINSGCGGAGCFRILGDRNGENNDAIKEESLGRIASVFPHWWNNAFIEYGNAEYPHNITCEDSLPFDLHAFKATIAPRHLLTVEGLDDTWANPYGSYRTWQASKPVFDLMGVPENNAIFYREGGHAFGDVDWKCLLDYCDYVFFGKGEAYWNNADRYFK